MIKLSSGLIFFIRVWLVVLTLQSGNPGGIILGSLGAFACITTVIAWMTGKPDLTWRGVTVGLLHLAPLLLHPGDPTYLGQAIVLCATGIQLWAKATLWTRTTVTGPVFVQVEARGPYALVRHPMTLSEMVIVIALCCEAATPYNVMIGVFVVWTKFALTRCEEGFLRGFFDYREYCRAVKWRMIPGVW